MRDQILKITDANMQQAMKIRESGSPVASIYFFIQREEEGLQVAAMPVPPDVDPREFAKRAADYAFQTSAMAVMSIHETWYTEGEDSVASQVWKAQGNSLKDFPGVKEGLIGAVDGVGINRLYLVEITPEGLGELDVKDDAIVGGQMANISGRLGEI
mgnify:CR=1 FL=1